MKKSTSMTLTILSTPANMGDQDLSHFIGYKFNKEYNTVKPLCDNSSLAIKSKFNSGLIVLHRLQRYSGLIPGSNIAT